MGTWGIRRKRQQDKGNFLLQIKGKQLERPEESGRAKRGDADGLKIVLCQWQGGNYLPESRGDFPPGAGRNKKTAAPEETEVCTTPESSGPRKISV